MENRFYFDGIYGALHGLISLNHADLDIRSWSYHHAAAPYDARSRSGVKRHTLHSKKKVLHFTNILFIISTSILFFDILNSKYTRRYLVFRWLAYYQYFGILNILIACVLLILWSTKYFDGLRIIGVLRILMGCVLLIF